MASDITPLLSSLTNFSGNMTSFKQVQSQGVALFGKDWQISFIRAIDKLKEDKKNFYLEKYNAFQSFGKALDVWNEASKAKKEDTYENLKFSLSDFEAWLPKFGVAGNELLDIIKSKLQPNQGQKFNPDAFLTEVVDKELIWEIDNFLKVFNYLDQSKSVLGMLALRQNINFEEYKYYGFVNDLYDYLIEKGQNLLKNQDKLRQILPQKIAGGAPALEKLISYYKNEKATHFNPDATSSNVTEGLTIDSLKEKIGEVAKGEGFANPDKPIN